MSGQNSPSEQALAELIEQLSRCAASEAFSRGLNPAQWSALRYFRRANRFSRTVSAFARYHGTTRGTASQTIRTLVDKGYLRRRPNPWDQRSFRLELTGRAQRLLGSDPFGAFVNAARTLPHEQRSVVVKGLGTVLERVMDGRAHKRFGVCATCRHFRTPDAAPGIGCGHQCALRDELLGAPELAGICVDHEPMARV
jgi:DNA-binding MarR family transcriptional regulator